MPDHSTFSKNRHGRFRDSDLLRRLFETVLQRCLDEGLVGGEGFAVDASLIHAAAGDRNRVEGGAGLPPDSAGRAVEEYLAALDDAAFGAATEVTSKLIAACPLRPRCWPTAPARKISCSIHEGARDRPRDRQDRGLPNLAPPAQKGRDCSHT